MNLSPRSLSTLLGLLLLPIAVSSGCYSDALEGEDEYESVVAQAGPRDPNAIATSSGPSAPGPTSPSPPGSTGPSPTGPVPTGTAPMGYVPTPGCEDVVGDIFAAEGKCAGAGCHAGPVPVDLVNAAGMQDRLVDMEGTFCADYKFIDTADPSASLLIKKLENPTECLTPMPVPPASITDAEKACIVEWVTAVAQGQLTLN